MVLPVSATRTSHSPMHFSPLLLPALLLLMHLSSHFISLPLAEGYGFIAGPL